MNYELLMMILEALYKTLIACTVIGAFLLMGVLLFLYLPRHDRIRKLEDDLREMKRMRTEDSKRRSEDQYERTSIVADFTDKMQELIEESSNQIKHERDLRYDAEAREMNAWKVADALARLLDRYKAKHGVMKGTKNEEAAILAILEMQKKRGEAA